MLVGTWFKILGCGKVKGYSLKSELALRHPQRHSCVLLGHLHTSQMHASMQKNATARMSANGALTTHPSPLDKGKSNDLDVHQEENEYTVTHSHFGENE